MMNLRAAKETSEPNGCTLPTMAARKLCKGLIIFLYLEKCHRAMKKIHFHLSTVKEAGIEKNNW